MFDQLKGFIFDLDGTLFDTQLDFDKMRIDLAFPKGAPILEQLALIQDTKELERCHQIIHEHEMYGAQIAKPFPYVLELLSLLKLRNIPHAIVTRNSKLPTKSLLKRYQLDYIYTITREDFVPKPDPSSLLHLKTMWDIENTHLCYIGDYLHDLEAARNAGMKSVLYRNHKNEEFEKEADMVIHCFNEILTTL